MKTAYFHCHSGVSGDMFIGSLLDAGLDFNLLEEEIKKLGLTGYRLERNSVTRNGLSAIKFDVILDQESSEERNLGDLLKIINASSLSPSIKERASGIFTRLAEAEAAVHGTLIDEIHFHEVGALDAMIDVAGAVSALELMGIEKVVSSPVNLGSGMVGSSHGQIPVPVPAVPELLKGKPVYSAGPQKELTTPTGAAILSALVDDFGPLPPMAIQTTGHGAGSQDFPDMPNLLRVFIGSTAGGETADTVAVMETNIDDLNPEFYAPFTEKALEAGALDVFLTPIIMKKGRPGVKVTILAQPDKQRELSALLFDETTTFGLRTRLETRDKLKRETVEVETVYGKVKVKLGKAGGRITKASPEAESCMQLAAEKQVPVRLVYDEAKRASQTLIQ